MEPVQFAGQGFDGDVNLRLGNRECSDGWSAPAAAGSGGHLLREWNGSDCCGSRFVGYCGFRRNDYRNMPARGGLDVLL
jgi:hypothetical protein